MQCIGEAFGVELGNDQDKAAHSIRPATLKSLVDVFAAAAQKKRVRARTTVNEYV